MQPSRVHGPRIWAFLITSFLTIFAAGWIAPVWQNAVAQDHNLRRPPAEASPADNAPATHPDQGLFWHIIKSAGPIFGPLLLFLSIALVALIVMLALDLRMGVAIPPGFVEGFTDTVNKRKFKEAFEMARNDPSFLAKVLTGGMSRLQYGIEDARDAALNMVDSLKSTKEQLNNYTAVISSLGPLVGLVGTVFGMIQSFKELAKGKQVEAAAAGRRHFAGSGHHDVRHRHRHSRAVF